MQQEEVDVILGAPSVNVCMHVRMYVYVSGWTSVSGVGVCAFTV